MRKADIGQNRVIRRGDGGDPAHFAELAHAHLHHGGVVFRRKAEHGQRQADLAVLVPLGLHHTHSRGKRKGRHFLRRGLADASCNADDGAAETRAPRRRDLLERLPRVLHGDERTAAVFRRRLLRQGNGSARRERFADITMRVGIFPDERNKQSARSNLPAVRGNRSDRRSGIAAQDRAPAGARSFLHRNFHDCKPPFQFICGRPGFRFSPPGRRLRLPVRPGGASRPGSPDSPHAPCPRGRQYRRLRHSPCST